MYYRFYPPLGKITSFDDHDVRDEYTSCIAFSPNGKMLATGHGNGRIKIWDTSSYKNTVVIKAHNDTVGSLSFSSDNKIIASAGMEGRIMLWNANTGDMVKVLTDKPIIDENKSYEKHIKVVFSPDGKYLYSGGTDDTIIIWDISSYTEKATLKHNGSSIVSIDISPDGNMLASRDGFGVTYLWNMKENNLLYKIGHSGGINYYSHCVIFSPDGKLLAYNNYNKDYCIVLWDIANNKQIYTYKLETDSRINYVFSKDGEMILVYAKPYLLSLETNTGNILHKTHPRINIYSIAVNSDNKIYATGGSNITLWDISKYK